MASRTVTTSVDRVSGPPADLERLEQALADLRGRYPGAIIERYLDRVPVLADDAFVAPGAAIIGDVQLGPQASVWFGCVIRGDLSHVRVGARSNLQDGTVVHLGDHDPTIIEEDVVVGHRAVVHGCTIGAGTLVGIAATILDGAKIGSGSVVGACSLVTAGTEIPPRSLVLGVPAKVVRTLSGSDEAFHRELAGKYTRLAHNYRVG
jgi:carbonic anhydrase/acetyltransferase-like protein (isoleucine patch superfamily)